ncbi:MAG: site-specific integrase [Thermoplasmatota archaeon]
MGRYPLKTAIGEYMNTTKDCYSPATIANKRIVLERLDREYSRLREDNPSLSPDPARWGEPEIVAVLLGMRGRGIAHASQLTELRVLNGLLKFLGNPILDTLKARMPHLFPKVVYQRGSSLTQDQLSAVLTAAESVKGWKGEYVRFLFATYAYTGLRSNELLMADRQDLDETNWTLRVNHPKGERTYGEKRIAPIPEPLRPVVLRYLKARETVLAKHGMLETGPLVFPEREPTKHLHRCTIKHWKKELEEESGVKFTIHGLRRTYGQILLDRGVPIEAVSLAMGHASTLTTEKHYCRKDPDSARLEVVNAFAESRNVPKVNPPVIEKKEFLPGYA